MDVTWSAWVAESWRPRHTWVGAFLLSALYVGSLYLWPKRYRSPRDSPTVIRRRTLSLLGTCVVACVLPFVALQVAPNCAAALDKCVQVPTSIAEATGVGSISSALHSSSASLFLCVALFFGPLAHVFLDGGGNAVIKLFTDAFSLQTAVKWRNYVVAPVAEEWVFRGLCGMTLVFAGAASVRESIFLSPLLFGLAHAHHFFEVRERLLLNELNRAENSGGDTGDRGISSGGDSTTITPPQLKTVQTIATKNALLLVTAQFAYTYVFGLFANFLLLRTGNIFGPITAHAFCNVLGVPDVGGVGALRGKQKIVVVVAYVAGIFVFAKSLWPVTDPGVHLESRWDDLVAMSVA